MRIALEIDRVPDPQRLRARRRTFLYRLWARIRFRQPHGWSDYHLAILDTGAPYSVVPLSLWPSLDRQEFDTLPLRGLVPGASVQLDATLARLSAQLLDAAHTSPRLPLWAMLVHTDSVPLILGWAGCLDRAKLTLDGPRHRSWLEF